MIAPVSRRLGAGPGGPGGPGPGGLSREAAGGGAFYLADRGYNGEMALNRAVCPPLALVGLLAAAPLAAQQPTNRDQSGYTELREEGFPIRNVVEVADAADVDLRDDEMVLGVVIEGAARAYPVNLMWKPENEVLNDRLGGAAITATW
jgi:hypothetical protein